MSAYRSCLSFLLTTASFSIGLTGISTSSWAIDFQPPSADELKMTSEPKAPGAPAIILFREVDRDDRGGFAVREDVYYRIKILTEEGRKYGDIELPYWKGSIDIKKLHARTIKPDGTVLNFNGKVFDQTIVKARGVKYRAKTFTMPDVVVGSIVEYFYTIELTGYFVSNSQWVLSDELFIKTAKFSLKPGGTLRMTFHYLPPGAQPVVLPNHEVHLEVSNIPPFRVEDFMPPENELKARVDFVYGYSFESDPDKYWMAFGKQCNEWFERFIGKPKAMEQAVAQIVSPSDSPEVKLEKIYARVQQLRNLTYEAAKTEQEQKRDKEKWPTNAEQVWKLQRGDGVDLTWLFAGLIRAAGIEAHGVWVSDRSNYFFDPKMMDRNRLNTNVVLVKLKGKDMYFDPGSAFIPFGMLPWSETGVSGYKLDKNGGSWIKTTLPDSSQSRVQRKAELKLTEAGDLDGKLTVMFTGLEASQRRAEERFADDAEHKKFLEDEVKEWIPVPSEVELTNQPDWKSSSPSMIAEFTLKVPSWASEAGSRSLLTVGLFGAGEKHLFDHAERVHPIYFRFPFQRVDEVTIEPPPGWKIMNVPEAQKKDGHVVVYASEARIDKGKLQLRRTLNVDIMLMDAKYYPALRDFFQTVSSADEQQVLLQAARASASN
ncbi:MAG: DUF3857 domain-containing protein [Terriglobales bacterium]